MGIQTMVYEEEYDLAEGKVALSVKIGNGQLGAIVIQLGTKLVNGSPFIGEDVKLSLGKPAGLIGKTLLIFTTVAMTAQAGEAVITYALNGGEKKLSKQQKQTPPEKDQPVRFRAEITFKA